MTVRAFDPVQPVSYVIIASFGQPTVLRWASTATGNDSDLSPVFLIFTTGGLQYHGYLLPSRYSAHAG